MDTTEQNKWDSFEDNLDVREYLENGNSIVRRWYLRFDNQDSMYHYIEGYRTNPSLAPIVAKGISAYLSFVAYYPDYKLYSLRYLLTNNIKIPSFDSIFNVYFLQCLKKLKGMEEIKLPLPGNRKTEEELIQEHIQIEEQHFLESKEIFDIVLNKDKNVMAGIKETALYYPQWVKKTYLNESNNNARPFPNEYSISQLKLIYSRSKEKKFIDCTEQCFLYWFGGIGEKQAKIKWIKERGKDPYKAALVSYAKKFNSETIPSMINDVFDIKVDSNNKECTRIKSLNEIFKDL